VRALFAFCVTLAAVGACKKPVDEVVDTITVSSFFTRTQATEELTLHRSGAGYADGKREIGEPTVRKLVEAIARPAVPTLDPSLFHFGAGEIHAALEEERLFHTRPTSWFARAEDPSTLGERIRDYYRSSPGGDRVLTYASVKLDVRFRDGRVVRLSSINVHEMMLPWTVAPADESHDTYDPALSEAIAALLPEGFLNRERIAGSNLIVSAIAREETFGRIREPRPAPSLVDPFHGRFEVQGAATGELVGFDARGEDGWSAWVTHADWKPVHFDLFLRKRTDGSYDTAPFLRDADAIVRRVRAVPWIAATLATSGSRVTIPYCDEGSMSNAARAKLGDDLRPWSKTVAQQLDGAIALRLDAIRELGWSDRLSSLQQTIWLLLPDGTSVHYFGDCHGMPGCVPVGQLVDRQGIPQRAGVANAPPKQ
jgi:hypothetical protein